MAVKTVKVDLPAEIFDATTNIPLMHQVVVAQLAAARQGTHATKTRGEVRGGGKKPYKQKGTGRARQGSTRAPQFAGGGTVHGPQPRDYDQRTPKKMKAAALRGALSDRARDNAIQVVEGFVTGSAPSTKQAVAALKEIGADVRSLIVLDRADAVSWLSLRNVPAVHIIAVDQLNTYDVLRADTVVFTKTAFDALVAGSQARPATLAEPVIESAEVAEVAEVTDAVELPKGAKAPLKSGKAPKGYEIKGNADSGLYHEPEGRWYDATEAEFWFKTAEDAEAAGFKRAGGGSAAESGAEESVEDDK